jgi:KUP system potassium uptake protein
MIRSMFINNILYEDNIIVSIIKREDPFGVTGFFQKDISDGLRVFEIQCGYMEVFDVEEILKEAGIEEKTIFYGLEDISTANPVWKLFSIIKRLTPTFVQFYQLPSHKLHGVVTRIEM